MKCGSNYGTSDPCCVIDWIEVPPEAQCSPSKPTCDYPIFGPLGLYGTCVGVRARPTVECASDFGSSNPCCGQESDDVTAQWQCSQSKPTCVSYMYNIQWGTCIEQGSTKLLTCVKDEKKERDVCMSV